MCIRDRVEAPVKEVSKEPEFNKNLLRKVDELELSVRSMNCLKNDNIIYIGDPVSYTHLRAHETGRNLVCRLLLEKKKINKEQPTSITLYFILSSTNNSLLTDPLYLTDLSKQPSQLSIAS